ncbi:MAG: sugar phosphate nucleotidyltransferase [Patescibacteria group bacterium]
MKVLILAAGRSKRMKPVEDKNFLKFLGKPLLQHQLEMLKMAGFREIIVIGGKHNLSRVKKMCAGLRGLKIKVCEQKNLELGMCGAILSAKNLISQEPVLILSSNDIVDTKAFKLIKEAAKNGKAESYILGKKVLKYFPGGYLKVDSKGYIQNIVEKPKQGSEPSNLVNLVVHVHKNPKKLIEYLKKSESKNDDRYEQALCSMIKDGVQMQVVPYEGFWQPIKFPWHVQSVFQFLFASAKKGISKSAVISKNAVINGDVIIGEHVKIFDGAVVAGPCYIGDGSIVATNSLVRESNIGENCVIGFNTEVARSYLGNDVWTHSNYIGDSVIENNVSFGAGTVLANLRLDEKNVCVNYDDDWIDTGNNKFGAVIGSNTRIGVNTSIMPGTRIGGGSFIGAGIIVSENIPENSFVRGKFSLKISKNKENIEDTKRDNFKKKL